MAASIFWVYGRKQEQVQVSSSGAGIYQAILSLHLILAIELRVGGLFITKLGRDSS